MYTEVKNDAKFQFLPVWIVTGFEYTIFTSHRSLVKKLYFFVPNSSAFLQSE